MIESIPPPGPPASAPPPLRPYQLEALSGVLHSVRHRLGLTIVIEISRQGGKNELSARLEAMLLTAARGAGGSIVKTAPTLQPQLTTSYRRLADYLTRDRIPHRTTWPQLHVGRALIDFRSAEPSANVAGATANLLLEVDEAQDVHPDTYQRRFRPMASTTGATTVLYGTAWSELDLLETTIQDNRRAERADGIRRNFIYPASIVGAHLPAYARFVASERARLGDDHPLIQTEYDLVPLAGEGRLFTADQLKQILGTHPSLPTPVLTERYAAGLDIGGEDTGSGRPNDRTVLTVARVHGGSAAIVAHRAWRGAPHADVIPAIADTLNTWRPFALVVDATGVGEPTAALLKRAAPHTRIEALKLTPATKSELGYDLITATNTGALKLYADDGSAHYATLSRELALARKEIRPNNTLAFYVDASQGNDDYLISLALTVRAATAFAPRVARGR